MSGQRFSSPEDNVENHVLKVSQSEWAKQTQMMVVRKNILSNVRLKNDKPCNGNVRLHLAAPESYQSTLVLNSKF